MSPMKPVIENGKSQAVIYDANLMGVPGPEHFNVDYWRAENSVVGEAIGRGSAWFLDTAFGPVVLRRYLRGGWVAKFNRQCYFYTSIKRSRPFREFNILAALYDQGLPVPRPVAALCEHHGVLSSGALITSRLESAQTLADLLPDGKSAADRATIPWEQIGGCIRQFHAAGVWHADLNARNIMLNAQMQVFLIDFDRARFTPGKEVSGEGNLKRLKRSLVKLWPINELSALTPAWAALEAGYDG